MSVRVRYAPSPTGLQHIGGIRTALFNYYFARANGGKFILRIEDTDQDRFSEEALQDLYDTLNWLGIDWDEGPDKDGGVGPYVQSERISLYQDYAKQLVDRGLAYYCYCTQDRLTELRERQKVEKKNYGYDRHCQNLSEEEKKEKVAEFAAKGLNPVIRLIVPVEGKTSFHDELLGDIKRKNKDVSPDPIILKSDGFPTYHLANVIDDHLMGITHIMRAQEWIPSGPLHILLYKAFGWETPKYVHLPMVMGKDGQKLSKRHGSTAVRDFKLNGYLPEAIVNYISLLGWSFDDSREFFTKKELEELFVIEKLNKAPAVFDYKKLEWFNGQYIRKTSIDDLKKMIVPVLQKEEIVSDPISKEEEAKLEGTLPIIHERLKLINDAAPMLSFLFKEIEDYDIATVIPKKMDGESTIKALEVSLELLENFDKKTDEEAEILFYDASQKIGLKLGQILMPVRIAITGSKISPPLFSSIRLLGLDKSIQRVNNLIDFIKKSEI